MPTDNNHPNDQLQNVRNPLNAASTATTSLTHSSDRHSTKSPEETLFQAQIIRILNKITDAWNMPALTETEQGERAKTWTELLFGIIPHDRLTDAYQRAFRDHQGLFPINAPELKAAWENIDREERNAVRNNTADLETRIAQCKYRDEHIADDSIAKSDALVEYKDFLNPGKWVVLPCAECRPHAYADRLDDHKSRNADKLKSAEQAHQTIENLATLAARNLAMLPVLPESADEILRRALTQTRDHNAWNSLQHARNWLKFGQYEPPTAVVDNSRTAESGSDLLVDV
jgi:hypothetical protein